MATNGSTRSLTGQTRATIDPAHHWRGQYLTSRHIHRFMLEGDTFGIVVLEPSLRSHPASLHPSVQSLPDPRPARGSLRAKKAPHAPLNGNAEGMSWAWIGFDHDARLFIASRACPSLAEGSVAIEARLLLAEPVVRQAASSAHFMWSNIHCLSEYWTERFPREPRQK